MLRVWAALGSLREDSIFPILVRACWAADLAFEECEGPFPVGPLCDPATSVRCLWFGRQLVLLANAGIFRERRCAFRSGSQVQWHACASSRQCQSAQTVARRGMSASQSVIDDNVGLAALAPSFLGQAVW